MFPHPDALVTFVELRHQDLLATAARERQAATAAAPALQWHTLAFRVVAFVALALGLRA